MERLAMDYKGQFGAFWKNEADKAIVKHMEHLEIIDDTPRWRMGNGIPSDILELLAVSGNITPEQQANGNAFRNAQQDAFLKEYRNRKHTITPEEQYEMRAAFGKGTVVVDVITGQKYTV